ncbi:MAG: hypothetical protein N4A49_01895 [Marinifilaceae bacterium]|jgi:hypothetical protein|nr:hypothetical protein [Marinifilaceae bacterium]
MTQDEAIATYKKKSSTKKELRKALAFMLNIEYCEIQKDTKSESIFSQCKKIFTDSYLEHVEIDYYWQAKDSFALTQIISKLNRLVELKGGDTKTAFEYMINKLPKWYKDNAFSVTIINSKFNEIISEIKQSHESSKAPISSDYKQKIIGDLLS